MSIRKIEYQITKDGITPDVRQNGGVQGEHMATEILFNLEQSLFLDLKKQAETLGGRLVYSISGYDGAGFIKKYAAKPLDEAAVTFFLENRITKYGGIIKLVLSVSCCSSGKSELELVSYPAQLYLTNLPAERRENKDEYKSLLSIAGGAVKSVEEAAGYAAESALSAQKAKKEADRAKAVKINYIPLPSDYETVSAAVETGTEVILLETINGKVYEYRKVHSDSTSITFSCSLNGTDLNGAYIKIRELVFNKILEPELKEKRLDIINTGSAAEDMIQPVGITHDGRLMTAPGHEIYVGTKEPADRSIKLFIDESIQNGGNV